jgi:hypothetical protein
MAAKRAVKRPGKRERKRAVKSTAQHLENASRAARRAETPADRRNYLRKKAGWPMKENRHG